MPVVISVFLFLFYHVIDNTNYKMARDGVIPVWQGTWTSSLVLIGLGVFFAYKALNDSTILNADTYVNFFKRIFGKRATRTIEQKELIIFETDYQKVKDKIILLDKQGLTYLQTRYFPNYLQFWKIGNQKPKLQEIVQTEESIVYELLNSRKQAVISCANKYPIVSTYRNFPPFAHQILNILLGILIPLGLVWYIQAWFYEKRMHKDIIQILEVNKEIERLINN